MTLGMDKQLHPIVLCGCIYSSTCVIWLWFNWSSSVKETAELIRRILSTCYIHILPLYPLRNAQLYRNGSLSMTPTEFVRSICIICNVNNVDTVINKYRIMYLLSWRSIYVLMTVLIGVHFPSWEATRELNVNIALDWAHKQFLTTENTLLYFLPHTTKLYITIKKEILTHQLRVSLALFMFCHYNAVIMRSTAPQITSLTSVYSAIYSCGDQRKHQSSASLALCGWFTGDRWNPHTKGQQREKYFHLMTSSYWWRHNQLHRRSVMLQLWRRHWKSYIWFGSYRVIHRPYRRPVE